MCSDFLIHRSISIMRLGTRSAEFEFNRVRDTPALNSLGASFPTTTCEGPRASTLSTDSPSKIDPCDLFMESGIIEPLDIGPVKSPTRNRYPAMCCMLGARSTVNNCPPLPSMDARHEVISQRCISKVGQ
eukprot:Blabericola_migrator_1__7658@NODE_3909_length_1434_cov_628_213606_g2414_i0_p3_GENE_NODE_3909_length_1434_cov_628_213606_g2414_i0NODE_3909_length_1434_cov_628_213606_g2414_i0_p3_ORF_typecomplete_len130_score0_83_NODE_3909_length_1434_cov_628_213606_g2414_i0129518